MKVNAIRSLLLIAVIAMAAGCAGTGNVRYTKWTVKQLDSAKLPKFDVPITVNDRVIAWIDYFQGPGRRHFSRYLSRSGRYIPMMQNILKQNGLPQDLVYLALIESGFSAKAYSRAKAVGHWQFIHSTGKMYNLSINSWMDERRHEEKSTQAAARYLKDLYDEFGDWYLAMAAYNAGPGKITKAIQITGTRNFWEMIDRDRHYLKAETKDYVPKFIAAAIIAKSPERFGFEDVVYQQPVETEKARVDGPTDLEVIARCAGVPVELIEDLNPELTKGITPPHIDGYLVNLPKGTAKAFEVAYAKVPPSERIMVVRHTVKRGESIGRIAKRYGVSVREILAANDLSSAHSLKKGMTIVIPTGGAAKQMADMVVAEESGRPSGKLVRYKVRKGDTLSLIAENYGVSRDSLKKWNNLKGGGLRVGSLLKIYVPEDDGLRTASAKRPSNIRGKSYIVRRGDTWSRIAQKNGVSIQELKEWNPRIAKSGLRSGQKLMVRFEERTVAAAGKKEAVGPSSAVAGVKTPVESMSVSDRLETPVIASGVGAHQSDLLTMRTEDGKGLPAASGVSLKDDPMMMPAEPVERKEPKTISYKIKSGDTIWDIAQKYNVTVKSIKDLNGLDKKSHKKLRPGDRIMIRTQ